MLIPEDETPAKVWVLAPKIGSSAFTTPPIVLSSSITLLPTSGSSLTSSSCMTVPVEEPASRIIFSAVVATSTSVAVPATTISKFKRTWAPTPSFTSVLVAVWNPSTFATILYTPVCRLGKLYTPTLLAVVFVSTPVWVLIAVIPAPGSTACDVSITVPLKEAPACPNAFTDKSNKGKSAIARIALMLRFVLDIELATS